MEGSCIGCGFPHNTDQFLKTKGAVNQQGDKKGVGGGDGAGFRGCAHACIDTAQKEYNCKQGRKRNNGGFPKLAQGHHHTGRIIALV